MNQTHVMRAILLLVGLYGLYLIKSAVGINLSDKYTAWNFLKYPVQSFIYK